MEYTEQDYFKQLEKVDEKLYKQDRIPLIEGFFPLDTEKFCEKLSESFSIDDLSLSLEGQKWRKDDEITQGFSGKTKSYSFTLTPFAYPAYLLIDDKDEKKFVSWVIPTKGLETRKLQEGFFQFFLLNTLEALEESGFLADLSPKLSMQNPPNDAFCLDIKLKKGRAVINGRLLLTRLFREEWNKHFSQIAPLEFSKPLAQNLDINLSVKLGQTNLKHPELLSLKKGDFIALDQTYYDPDSQKGSFRLMFDDVCLFRAKVNENRLKLLEYSQNHEEIPMQEDNQNPEELPIEHVEEKPKSLQDIPLEVSVEVAKLSMPLGKLKELRPGNYLTLPVVPDQGVNLVVNNQTIGKAELVYLGEKLGVRILELGKKS